MLGRPHHMKGTYFPKLIAFSRNMIKITMTWIKVMNIINSHLQKSEINSNKQKKEGKHIVGGPIVTASSPPYSLNSSIPSMLLDYSPGLSMYALLMWALSTL